LQPVRACRTSSPKGVGTVTNEAPVETGAKARMLRREAPAALVRVRASMSPCGREPARARRRKSLREASGRDAPSTAIDGRSDISKCTWMTLYHLVAIKGGFSVGIEDRADFQEETIRIMNLVMKLKGFVVVMPITIMGWTAVGLRKGATGRTMAAAVDLTMVTVPPRPVARHRDSVATAGAMGGVAGLKTRMAIPVATSVVVVKDVTRGSPAGVKTVG
jgi:hypothetical protein